MSEKVKILVEDSAQGLRIDKAIAALTEISRLKARKCLDAGSVYLNGRRHHLASFLVKKGDLIEIFIDFQPSISTFPQPEILFADDYLLAVDKPQGIPATATQQAEAGTLPSILKRMLDLKSRPLPAHRLDRLTSGVMLLGKDKATALKLAAQFAEHSARKIYLAAAQGIPKLTEGEIDARIGRHPTDSLLRRISEDGKPAKTLYKILGRKNEMTLLSLEPLTGRTHQIRLHLRYLGCPVIGDPVYGIKQQGFTMMLHAYRLVFRHPQTGDELTITAPLPARFSLFSNLVNGADLRHQLSP
jgi:23S rRNA pseudouridine1911/1915/1917 synthase